MKRNILLVAILGSLVFPTLVQTQEPQPVSAAVKSGVFSFEFS